MLDIEDPHAESYDNATTAEKKRLFIHYLAQTCNMTKSAELAGVHRATIYVWRDNDPVFAADVQQARERGFERCEDEMHRRAYEGTVVATKSGLIREYSDTLAIFLAKAHKPERYSERLKQELSGPGGVPLDTDKISARMNFILNAVLHRKAQAGEPQQIAPPDDYSDVL